MKKFKTSLFAIIFFIALGFIGALIINNKFAKKEVYLQDVETSGIISKKNEKTLRKIKITNLLVENIIEKKELITMEVDLREDVLWIDSFTDFEIFKKQQRLTFFGVGTFTTDLGKLTKNNISFNEFTNEIMVYIDKPKIKSITIEEDKTVINKVERGFLRFGEIKVTSDEQNEIYNKVKAAMNEKMNEKELENQAEEKTVKVVTEIIQTFLISSGFGNVKTYVYLK